MATDASWWSGRPDEIYWMEITDREDLGADLHAPKRDGAGREYWSYSLVAEVQEGDVVLHWWKRPGGEPAIVGWSSAVGEAKTSTISWEAHGSYGRGRGAKTQPSWRMPLQDFTEPETPITLADLRAVEPALRTVHEVLRAAVSGPLYFPFAFSDKRPLRTTQGYLVKVPAALVAAVPGLSNEIGRSAPATAPGAAAGTDASEAVPDRKQADPALRMALERHAVDRAVAYLTELGYECEDVGTFRPYDLVAVAADGTTTHVEVKGSSGERLTVGLTDGEVQHARSFEETLLVVVDGIRWERGERTIETSGGRMRLWWNWRPEDDALVPTEYRYLLPPEENEPTA